jgi:(2R)-3-sulfolactate dehydrogenase (NADP+)
MLKDEGVRLPGARREALRRKAEAEGVEVAAAVIASLSAIT